MAMFPDPSERPTTGEPLVVPIGWSAAGDWLTVDLAAGPMVIAGADGTGKTTMTNRVLAHVLAHGVRALHLSMRTDPLAAGTRLNEAADIMRARSEGREKVGEPIVLVVDDADALVVGAPAFGECLAEVVTALSREASTGWARDLGVYVVVSATHVLWGGAEVRDAMATRVGLGPMSGMIRGALFRGLPALTNPATGVESNPAEWRDLPLHRAYLAPQPEGAGWEEIQVPRPPMAVLPVDPGGSVEDSAPVFPMVDESGQFAAAISSPAGVAAGAAVSA